jgi:hypothetical protein
MVFPSVSQLRLDAVRRAAGTRNFQAHRMALVFMFALPRSAAPRRSGSHT